MTIPKGSTFVLQEVQRGGESVVQKKICEEIIPENLPKFGKDIDLQFMNLSEPQTE